MINLRHNLDYVDRYDNLNGFWMSFGFLLFFGTFFGVAGLLAAFGTLGLIGLSPALISIIFFLTGNKSRLCYKDAVAWDHYRALSPASREALNITPKYLRSIPAGEDWNRLRSNLKVLLEAEHAAAREKELLSGRTGQTLETIDNLIQGANSDLETLSNMRKEMT